MKINGPGKYTIFTYLIEIIHLPILQDFAHYKSGVYKHITGDVMGGHAVKLIGWGTSDDGEDYWVCVNNTISFFRFHDHCFSYDISIYSCSLFLSQLLANQWNRGWGDVGSFDQNFSPC